jgi:hypothetical protein
MPPAAQLHPGTRQPSPAPIISVHGHLVTGAGFLPDHDVTIRISCAEDDVNHYLTYITDPRGHLHAELPAGAAGGAVRITATDHRPDQDGECGRLWSNTHPLIARHT